MTVVSYTDIVGQNELYNSVKYCKYVVKRHFVSRRRADDCFTNASDITGVENDWVHLFHPLERVLGRLCVKVFSLVFLTVIFLRENEGILQNTVGCSHLVFFNVVLTRVLTGEGSDVTV